MPPRLHFEDFAPGSTRIDGGVTVTKDDIVAFARRFDPQPFHIDEEAAKRAFVGGLIASGWHTCALTMRMIADGFILDTASMGAPGIEELKWLQPVRPGNTLRVRATVLDARPSQSRPDRGLVRFRFEALNQADEIAMVQTNWIMIGRRDASPLPEAEASTRSQSPGQAKAASRSASPLPQAREEDVMISPFDDLVPGATSQLEAHRFTADDIIDFAQRFDPQPFHVDPEAARRSSFGGLAASGWHTAAVWMRLMITHREHAAQARKPTIELGPSPGFTDLRWLKPVYADDTIAYSSTLTDKRPSASRPGWNLAHHRNIGVNQTGDEVFRFQSCVFWRERVGS